MSDIINMQITGLSELLSSLDGQDIRRGAKSGLKKVGGSVKTLASSLIRDQYNLKKSDVDSNFEVIATDDSVLIVCTSRPINLTKFGATQFGSSGGKRVTVKRVGSGIKKSVRGKAGKFGGVSVPIESSHTTLLFGAFIAKVKAGKQGAFNIGVFKRASHTSKTQYNDTRSRRKTGRPYVMVARTKNPRQAIINTAFVTVSTLFQGKRVMPGIDEYLQTDALKTIQHEIEWAMGNKS